MKKTYIALAVLAMAALAGCQENEFRNDAYVPKEGEVLFRISKSDKTTKSAESIAEVRGETFSLGADANGTTYVLEETIVNLNDAMFAPMTKGTPAYTENFSALYGSFNAAVYKAGSVYEADGTFEEVDKDNLIYKRKYPNDIWDKESESAPNLYFFLRTPVDYIDANTDELTYNPSNGKISFTYTSPATAAEQKDMLFTSRPLTTATDFNDYFTKADQGLPVLFHHALTGVKFAIAADVMDHVTITGVKFTGLADSGDCVISPRQETDGYVDDKTGDYSSAEVSIWDEESLGFGGTEFSQTFSGVVTYTSAGTGVAKFPDSFYLAGHNNNLNAADASETFWFIPQPMTDDVELTISYEIDGVAQDDWTIEFGTTLKGKNVTWKAGELHTYTIRIDDVNVQIEDVIDMAEKSEQTIITPWGEKKADSYEGSTKTDVVITNTGNTDAYIRVALIGQWRNTDGNPVFGFTDYTEGVQLVDSWYEDLFVKKTNIQGKFTGLPGSNWVEGSDGYYYYTIAVPAGEEVPDELFTEYKVGKCPAAAVAGEVQNIYFTLEIAVQAISAKKLDGSNYTYSEAWDRALAME